MSSLNINKEEYFELKKSYNQAVLDKKDSFIFQDKELVTDYAKYLLEHLNNTFKYE
jgi:hypothetical protein